MTILRVMAQSISHVTTDLRFEIYRRSDATLLDSVSMVAREWVTTFEVEVNVLPQDLAKKDIDIHVVPLARLAGTDVRLYQMTLNSHQIYQLSATVAIQHGVRSAPPIGVHRRLAGSVSDEHVVRSATPTTGSTA